MKLLHGPAACALTLLLAACSTSGVRVDFDLKGTPGTPVFESEKDFATAVVGGRYRLSNNVWNKGATTGRYRQKIFINDDGGKPVFGWIWKWRDSSGVATYPEIQVGYSPWNGEAGPDSGFPFQVGTKKVVASYDVTLQASGAYNMAFEFWAVSALPPTKDSITHEVMIWIAGERLAAAGSQVGKATIQGNDFTLCMRKNHGDASGANENTWTIISLLADKPMLHGPLDVSQITDYLLKQGYLGSHLFIANLELGDEVMRGSGSAIVRNFSVTVD